MPALTSTGVQKLRDYLQQTAKTLPAPFVGVASSQDVLFFERAGLLDPLNPEAGGPKEDSIYWFASTTKLLTAVATLQLVDAGIFTLDTPISKYFPQLSAPYQIIRSIGDDGVPVFETSEEEITILHLANQTSGFGLEMGPEVQGWKKWSGKATGHTNTCKLDNLLPIPPTELPGRRFEYGNGSEWLGILIQKATGKDLDEVFRSQIFDPLGMKSTTFYPFGEAQKDKLLPLRWLEHKANGSTEWQKLKGQCDLLDLPRLREDIEYPAGGGGIYTAPSDYLILLQHLLSHRLSQTASSTLSLSASAIASIFLPTLPDTDLGHAGLAPRAEKYGVDALGRDLNWSTAVALFSYPNGGQRPLSGGRKGRTDGSAGWSGAPGIEYWMDPAKGIAVVLGSQLLPGNCDEIEQFKVDVEALVYEALEA